MKRTPGIGTHHKGLCCYSDSQVTRQPHLHSPVSHRLHRHTTLQLGKYKFLYKKQLVQDAFSQLTRICIRPVACGGGGGGGARGAFPVFCFLKLIIPKINTGIATWYLLRRHCPPPHTYLGQATALCIQFEIQSDSEQMPFLLKLFDTVRDSISTRDHLVSSYCSSSYFQRKRFHSSFHPINSAMF